MEERFLFDVHITKSRGVFQMKIIMMTVTASAPENTLSFPAFPTVNQMDNWKERDIPEGWNDWPGDEQ